MPAAEWDLDPAAYDVWALRASGRLPARAAWLTSPEPKAAQTAQPPDLERWASSAMPDVIRVEA